MSITKYRIFPGSSGIEVVEVIKETKASIWRAGFQIGKGEPTPVKEAKFTDHRQYHDTWAQAHQALIDDAHAKLIAARARLQRCQAYAGNVKGMKPPKA